MKWKRLSRALRWVKGTRMSATLLLREGLKRISDGKIRR